MTNYVTQVVAHLWRNAKALRVAAGLQLQCTDNVSLLEYTLASCDFLSILLESRSLERRQVGSQSGPHSMKSTLIKVSSDVLMVEKLSMC